MVDITYDTPSSLIERENNTQKRCRLNAKKVIKYNKLSRDTYGAIYSVMSVTISDTHTYSRSK